MSQWAAESVSRYVGEGERRERGGVVRTRTLCVRRRIARVGDANDDVDNDDDDEGDDVSFWCRGCGEWERVLWRKSEAGWRNFRWERMDLE